MLLSRQLSRGALARANVGDDVVPFTLTRAILALALRACSAVRARSRRAQSIR